MIGVQNIQTKLGAPNYRATVVNKYHNTSDIISQIQKAHKINLPYAAKIAKQFKANTTAATCRKIFDFIKNNVRYNVEPATRQTTKTLPRLLADGHGDCKHYSGLFATILQQLNIPFAYRFASYNPADKTPTHVYVVAYNEANKPIVCDAVLNFFDTEKPYQHKIDKKMSLYHLSGVEDAEIGKINLKKALKKAGGAVKTVVKKTGGAVKKAGKAVAKTVKKTTNLGKKMAIAPMRTAFLGLVMLNFRGFATNLVKSMAQNPNDIKKRWQKFGGDFNALKKAAEKGAKNKRIMGVDAIGAVSLNSIVVNPNNLTYTKRKTSQLKPVYSISGVDAVGAISVAAALAAATPVIIVMQQFVGAGKDLIKEGKEAFEKTTGQSVENTPLTGTDTTAPEVPGVDTVAPGGQSGSSNKNILPLVIAGATGVYLLTKK